MSIAALILLVVQLVIRSVEVIIKKRSEKYDLDEGKKFAFIKLIKYFIYVLALVLVLESLGFDITLLLAGSAALLVGIGLGLQEIFRDLISGIIILFDGSIQVGDVIEIESLVGVVKEINIRTSKVRTRDGIIIIVPNGYFINQKVINWSNSNKLTRFKVDVGVAYGSDVRLVEKLLVECAEANELVNALADFVASGAYEAQIATPVAPEAAAVPRPVVAGHNFEVHRRKRVKFFRVL